MAKRLKKKIKPWILLQVGSLATFLICQLSNSQQNLLHTNHVDRKKNVIILFLSLKTRKRLGVLVLIIYLNSMIRKVPAEK